MGRALLVVSFFGGGGGGTVAGRDRSGRQRRWANSNSNSVEAGDGGRRRYLDLFEAGTETLCAASLCVLSLPFPPEMTAPRGAPQTWSLLLSPSRQAHQRAAPSKPLARLPAASPSPARATGGRRPVTRPEPRRPLTRPRSPSPGPRTSRQRPRRGRRIPGV